MASEKRELQKKNREKAIKKAKTQKLIWTIVGIVIALAIAGGIGYLVWEETVNTTKAIEDYSKGLDINGKIVGMDTNTMVALCDYKNITANYDELAPTDEEIQEHIQTKLDANKELSTEKGVVVNEGDSINLDYVGKVDGVEFEGGSTQGGGTDIVLGQAGYIDDFEQQIMGTKTGDSYTINVTFPEDYGKEELNGKEATFDITINGINYAPEFNDEFVEKNLSEYASTADEYREYYKETTFQSKLKEYVDTYVIDNSGIISYPNGYLKTVRGQVKFSDEQALANYNASYAQYMGGEIDSLYEYMGTTKKDYETSLDTQSADKAKENMVIQAIFEDAGLVVTQEDKDAVLSDTFGTEPTYYNQIAETYGEGYINQLAMKTLVKNYLMDNVIVNK